MAPSSWKHCSTCHKDLGFSEKYYACSVSTCNRPRIGLFFCSVPCWEAHLPEARHRDAWAEEQRAPSREEGERAAAAEAAASSPRETSTSASRASTPSERPGDGVAARRRVVGVTTAPSEMPAPPDGNDAELPRDVLVVVSKLKQYIKARSGMNTSETVVEAISDHLRSLCTEAIRNAARDGRKTVMDRDFAPLFKS